MFCRCHEGIPLDFGPWGSLMTEIVVVLSLREDAE